MTLESLPRLALAACFAALSSGAFAQAAPPADPKAPPAAEKKADEKKPEAKKEEKKPEPPKEKNIDDTVKDFQKIPGLLTLYRKKTSTMDTIYAEVPEALLGKMMLLQVTAGSGLGDTSAQVFHGQPLADVAFKLVKDSDGKIEMIQPNLAHRATNPEARRVVARSFPDGILQTFDVKARQEDRKSVLIEVSPLFKGDIGDVQMSLSGGPFAALMGGGGGYGIDSSRTDLGSIKNFPENLYVRADLVLNRRGPFDGPKSVPFAVAYNLSVLPETGYKPRLGDPRVGYFTVSYEDLDDVNLAENTVNLIQRWNLVKKNPAAALSEPVKPIVFWIDNGTPKQYRQSVREGLLMYNAAFERIGFKDAIVVKQMPDDADWDIADLRYNVVRWTTGMPFAIALFRANPLTGEILNASINMDGVFAQGGTQEYEGVFDPAAMFATKGSLRADGKHDHDHGDDPRRCSLLREGAERFAFAGVAMSAAGLGGTLTKEELAKQYVREVVAHEFGHCLGLRHNFAASNELTMAQLADRSFTDKYGTGASVMDYNDFNIGALKRPGVPVYSDKIGTYDHFAIEYGYTPTSAVTSKGELPTLRKIASKGSLPGYRYQSDGTVNDYDPTVATFDLSREPMEYMKRNLEVSRWLLFNLEREYPRNGKSYYDFSWRWVGALNRYFRAAAFLPRYLGGATLSNAFAGDPMGKVPLTPVAPERQKAALALLNRYVFAPDAFAFPASAYGKLTFSPDTMENEAPSFAREFPLKESFEGFQNAAVRTVFSPLTLARISENELRSGGKNLTLPEFFTSTRGNVWAETASGSAIAPLRRSLQMAHLNALVALARAGRGAPTDVPTLASDSLRWILSTARAAESKTTDAMTKAHLSQVESVAARALRG